jgi:CTP synthase (UTP-ammonia lyase)
VLIGIVGDRQPSNRTHQTLEASLDHAGVGWEWVATDAVPDADSLTGRYAGLWIAPASPYRSMEGALRAITAARTRGVPLVGT